MFTTPHLSSHSTTDPKPGGGIHGEDALSKLSHTATVFVAVFFIDPNPNRFVGPKFLYCMLPSPLCGIFSLWLPSRANEERPPPKKNTLYLHRAF